MRGLGLGGFYSRGVGSRAITILGFGLSVHAGGDTAADWNYLSGDRMGESGADDRMPLVMLASLPRAPM